MKQKKRMEIYKILLLLVILLTAFILFEGMPIPGRNQGQPRLLRQGSLDLDGWNAAEGELINLKGEWEFYWQRLLTYDDFRKGDYKSDLLVDVPRVWNGYRINGKRLPGFGTATYRLRIRNAEEGQAFGIRMSTVSTAYRLYINERLVAFNGQVGMDKQHYKPGYKPMVADFTAPSGSFDIILQVANFSYARGGVWYPIFMGSEQKIEKYEKSIGYRDLFMIGAFLIMALYYLCTFFMRREDKSSLYFVLMCMVAASRTIIYGDYIITVIFPWVGYRVNVFLEYVTGIWFPVVFVLLIGELFPAYTSRRLRRLFVVYSIGMTFFVMVTPVWLFTTLTYLIESIVLVIAAYAMFCTLRAYWQHEKDSAIILTGGMIAILAGVHDVLYQNNILSASNGEISSFGFLILLFLQAFILARRFSEAFKETQLLSERLLALDKLKDEFLANTSHELRTPLNAMINIAEGIARGTNGAVNEEQKTSLSIIATSGKRLTHLINDILDYSKLKNFDLEMNFETVKLKRTAESVINVLEASKKRDEIQLLVDIPDNLPDVYADEGRLLQILYNLVGNAQKFTKTGYIKIWAERSGDQVEVCVEDTGVGIPSDMLDIIFEPFRQLEASLTRKEGGTGLGLSITQNLVELHGGKIRVESKLDVGSKFYFSLPVSNEIINEEPRLLEQTEAQAAVMQYYEGQMEELPSKHEGRGPHIILVDDNMTNLISLVGILKLENYATTAVTSSEEFFKAFSGAEAVALVILDVMLPGMSGYEICREIRKSHTVSELPVLLLTARTTTQDIVMGMEAGANDYLTKPFDTDELLARVKTLTQLKQSVDRAKASELAFLQAQIKPHFLYNALNTIVSVSMYDMERARNLIIELGNYLRRSFDFKGLSQMAPLKNELELLRAYLEIEKARFEERIEVVYELPEDMEIRIPILMLQPVVENAVIHGILPKEEGGCIEVRIVRDDTALHILVKDNGIGMEPEKKMHIREREYGKGVGITNIDSRLRKLYGSGLRIESSIGAGTEVSWDIPIGSRKEE